MNEISKMNGLTQDFMVENKDKLNWKLVTINNNLDYHFMDKMEKYICWSYVAAYQRFPEWFAEKYFDRFDNDDLLRYNIVSEEFFLKHYDCDINNLNLYIQHQKVREEFIQEHLDKIQANNILVNNQKMSSDFLEKNIKYFKGQEHLFTKHDLTQEFISSHFEKIGAWNLIINQVLNETLIDKYIYKIKLSIKNET